MLVFPSRLPDYRRDALPSNETVGLGSVIFFAIARFYRDGWLVDALSAAATALSASLTNGCFENVRKSCAMQGSNLRLLACEASALPLS